MSLTLLGVGGLDGISAIGVAGPPVVVMAYEQPASNTATSPANTIASLPAGTLVVAWIDSQFRVPTNFQDSVGNTYVQGGAATLLPVSQECSFWFSFITVPIVAGSTTFTVTSGTSAFFQVNAFPEALASEQVATSQAGATGASTTPALTIPARTTVNTLMIMGLMCPTNLTTFGAVAGWTRLNRSSVIDFGTDVYYRYSTSNASDASFSGTMTSTNWALQYLTFSR